MKPISPLRAHIERIATSTHPLVHLHNFATHYVVTPTDVFMSWLTLHTHLAYVALFLGSYFETLVGPSFVIPGEVFLLSGSILAGRGILSIWLVIIVLYLGAILGDACSYFIGRAIGTSLFQKDNKILNLKAYDKVEAVFDKFGPSAIFFARFVGPFSKIVPVLAGVFEIPPRTFFLYNIPGIFIGVGQFIIVGYFFGNRYELVLLLLERYFLFFVVLVVVAIFLYWYFRKVRSSRS